MHGDIIINKVPGNFHISTHAYSSVVDALIMRGHRIDFSHRINHLSFGNSTPQGVINRALKLKRNSNPLDGHEVRQGALPSNHRVFMNYFLNIVETFRDGKKEEFEFTHSSHSVAYHGYPAIFFRFELSPVSVSY